MGPGVLRLIFTAAAVVAAFPAIADTFLTIPGVSYHLQRHRGYNEINTGIGLEHELNDDWRVGGGVYRNSIRKDSYYAGAIYTPWSVYGVKVGTSLGVVTGYGNPLPMVLPTFIYEGCEYGVKRRGRAADRRSCEIRRHRHSDEMEVPVVPRKPADGLTPAERDVLEAVAQGLSDKETARRLGKEYHTVRCQVQAALKKLGAENRPHAVALYLAPERFAKVT